MARSKPDSAPPFLRLVPQRDRVGDCCIAALATLCAVQWEEALVAAIKTFPRALTAGLSTRQTLEAGRRLGVRLKVKRSGRFDLNEACGILHVFKRTPPLESHAVVLTGRGDIYDGRDNALWAADAYLLHHNYRTGSLTTREDA